MSTALRVYVDTSAIGGCFEPQFAEDSLRLFDLARRGKLLVVIGDVVLQELEQAPTRVQSVLRDLPSSAMERVALSEDIVRLRNAYVDKGIVGRRWIDDATHVATAVVSRSDAIVSWNFKHIVRLDRIVAFNEVNGSLGYRAIAILTPKGVRDDGPETD